MRNAGSVGSMIGLLNLPCELRSNLQLSEAMTMKAKYSTLVLGLGSKVSS